jgi:hypothetical protein
MTERDDVARAITFFGSCEDDVLLHQLIAEIAPKARRIVGEMIAAGNEETIPPPSDLRAARDAATKQQALQTLRRTADFSLLQVMARAIGQRIETIEIAASADFPEGVRVTVPSRVAFLPPPARSAGTVEATGTNLQVLLDNGETWNGPPSLARLEADS